MVSITISGIQEFTDSEMVILLRNALAMASIGQSYTIAGRTFTRANITEIGSMIAEFENRVSAGVSGDNGNNVLVKFGGQR